MQDLFAIATSPITAVLVAIVIGAVLYKVLKRPWWPIAINRLPEGDYVILKKDPTLIVVSQWEKESKKKKGYRFKVTWNSLSRHSAHTPQIGATFQITLDKRTSRKKVSDYTPPKPYDFAHSAPQR